MSEEINEGDLVRIPQMATLIAFNMDEDPTRTTKNLGKPLAAVFLGIKTIHHAEYAEILLDNEIWFTEPDNIQIWRDHASKND